MVALFSFKLKAITFDDFYTLRYPVGEREDIIYLILKVLKNQKLNVDDEEFLKQYFREDGIYRKKLKETLRESLLDDIVMNALIRCGYKPKNIVRIVKEAVDYGTKQAQIRKSRWYPDAKKNASNLTKKGLQAWVNI